MTKITGLIGDPVSHSRSPAIHTAAFAYLGIDARYELWHTPAQDLETRVAALRGADVLGANVTLPHKRAVIELLDRIDPQAALIGAVNTIVRAPDGTLAGLNTDAPAFLAALREDLDYAPQGQTVVILGASGAARAAAAVLLEAGVDGLVLINRTLEHAEALLADLLAACERDPLLLALAPDDPTLEEALASASLLVNATSLGWHGDETPLPAALIPPGVLVYDMVYRPTRLLRDAAACGARTADGLGMLVRQAALAFEQWTGQPAPLDVMRAAVSLHQA